MESANLHHQHQLQEQLIGSSSLATPFLYGVGSNHAWNSNLILNDANFSPNVCGVLSNTRELRQSDNNLVSHLNTSTIHELGFSNTGSFTNHSTNQLDLAKIKEELLDSFSKPGGTVNGASNLEEFHLPSTGYIKPGQHDLHDLSGKILLKSFYSGCQNNGLQLSAGELYSNSQSCANFGGIDTSSGGNFSQIFPSTNVSNLNQLYSTLSSSLGMNLQALDLLTSTKFGGSFSQPSQNNLGRFKETQSCSLDHLQKSSHRPSSSPNKMSSFTNGVAQTKRPCNFAEAKASNATTKKPRLESRPSIPPFKVRKEKLRDRVAALQQLVAPFGKTDTASVLMEAIGCIKFLQDQIETLSMPYMKSSRNKAFRKIQWGSSEADRNEETNRDLRSRGLCLVPVSCTAYVANDIGSAWPAPRFSGGT